jgi:4-amino-4-deoxy-L-arabinose transferase-like glycosyltransferase
MQFLLGRPWLIFAVALAIRLTYISLQDNRDWANWGDEGPQIALNLLLGKGYTFTYSIYEECRSFRVPVWPLTLYLIWLVTGFSILAAKVVTAVISSGTCVVLYFLGRRLFHDGAGLLAGLVAAVFPTLVYWSGTLSSETLAIFLMVLGVSLLCSGERLARVAAAGLCLGLLGLTRPVYLPFPFLIAFGMICARRDRVAWQRAACLVVVSASLWSLWIVRNAYVHGVFVPASTEGGKTFLECHNPVAFSRGGNAFADWVEDYAETVPAVKAKAGRVTEVELDRLMYLEGLAFIRERPVEYLRAFCQRIEYLWRPFPRLVRNELSWRHVVVMAVTWTPVFLLGVYGLIRCRLWRVPSHLPILIAVLWVTLSAGLIRGCIRYRAPLEPFVILYAAAGLHMLQRASNRSARRLIPEHLPDPRNSLHGR